jgi:hypothetical protein
MMHLIVLVINMFAKWASSTAIQVSSKLLIAILAGYAFTSGYVALSSILLVKLGMPMGEAAVLNGMLGFILYLYVILWVFATKKLWRTSAIIILMAVAMIVVSPYLVNS